MNNKDLESFFVQKFTINTTDTISTDTQTIPKTTETTTFDKCIQKPTTQPYCSTWSITNHPTVFGGDCVNQQKLWSKGIDDGNTMGVMTMFQTKKGEWTLVGYVVRDNTSSDMSANVFKLWAQKVNQYHSDRFNYRIVTGNGVAVNVGEDIQWMMDQTTLADFGFGSSYTVHLYQK